MTDNIINELPEIFQSNICTLKRASLDDANKQYMCDSSLKVIHFDKLPNEYARGRGWPGVPSSNDALYIDVSGKWYFIEFKNGGIQKHDLFRKLYDSLILLWDQKLIPDLDFARENINYILVYNGEKFGRTQDSPAREATYDYLEQLAKQEKRLFEIDKFEKYLFNETHTYTKELFKERFIDLKESEELEKNEYEIM